MTRTLLLVGGTVVLLAGLLFLAQGTGWFPYPRSSFMVGRSSWAYRGVGLVTLGGALTVLSRSVGRR